MFPYLFFISFLFIQLFAQTTLDSIYVSKTKEIKLSDIDANVIHDKIIYTISPTKHTRKVKTKELLRLLNDNDLNTYVAKHSYVKFVQKSPIDTSEIKKFAQEYYKKHYPTIKIQKILITPRSFTTTLAKQYTLRMQKKSFLRHNAILVLKSYKGRKGKFLSRMDGIKKFQMSSLSTFLRY